jgi:predicted DNA-binding WGR domain protein
MTTMTDDDEDEKPAAVARHFELSEDGSNKFWAIYIAGAAYSVRYGKIGTVGHTNSKEFESATAARKDADKLIGQKLKKGYKEVPAKGNPASGNSSKRRK